MAKLAFIGLGVMGAPMARHLIEKGNHQLAVYNRSAEKAQRFAEKYHVVFASTPAEAAENAEIIFSCVGNDDDVRDITIGTHGAFHAMTPGSIFVDHTTTSAHLARELFADAQQSNLHFIDAPVSGGQAGAENGALTVMCGGELSSYEKAAAVMAVYAKSCRLMGEAGYGQLTKMVNQICIAGLVQALSEGIYFAEKTGLDVEAVLSVISKGAAGSWQMDNRGKTMHQRQFDFGFAVDFMRKDLGIVFDEAQKHGLSLPVTEMVDGFYAELQNDGANRLDTSSLIKRLL